MTEISFGDNVKVVTAPETTGAGIAGTTGRVYGVTTPSVTAIQPLGHSGVDMAYNVYFDETGTDVWLAPHLVEFVDHAPGTVATLNGVEDQWTRAGSGEWIEARDGTRHVSLFQRFLAALKRRSQ
jgi:hypothetical protein